MTTVFLWTGFIGIMLVVIAATVLGVVWAIDQIIRKTKSIELIFKVVTRFYVSMPKKEHNHRYVLALFDYERQKFIERIHLDEYGETDEEYDEWRSEMKKKHSFKKREV